MTTSAAPPSSKVEPNVYVFLGGSVLGVVLGALVVVAGSSYARDGQMTWLDVLLATAEVGFRGSVIALHAAWIIWFPILRRISRRRRKLVQLPIMVGAGAATAIPVAILDAVLGLHPGFSGILGITPASLAYGAQPSHGYLRWLPNDQRR